jgi:hypothetical protein
MWKKAQFLAALGGFAVCLHGVAADTNNAAPKITLRQKLPSTLKIQPPASRQEATRIKRLIHNLAKIDHPDAGISATFSGYSFSAVSGLDRFDGGLLVPGNAMRSDDLVELVKFGPKAIPFLIESLKDKTATKLTMEPPLDYIDAMWFDHELEGNPANENERRIIASRPRMDLSSSQFLQEKVSSHTVTVGELCFVIIGQIVNRPYAAARYQMTACVILNSPTHDPILANEVRDLWSSANPVQHLFDSLVTDFVTEKIEYPGEHSLPSQWMRPDDLQCGAAMRLLYYFPKETTNMIALRLRELNVNKRENQNVSAVRAVDFIKAVAWSKEPSIRAELRRIFNVTTDPEILTTSIAAMDPSDALAFRARLEQFLSETPNTESPNPEEGPFGEGYELLVALGKHFGLEAKPAFDRYMVNASLQRRRSMCRVLTEVHGNWSIDLLGPLLDDTRSVAAWYAVIPDQDEHRLPIRICDEAAETISKNFPKLAFKMAGQHKDLDGQIQKMHSQIARRDY